MSNEPLKIFDESFFVTAQIERAPHWTMIRELTMNAIEAAARASGDKIVHWTSGTYHGVRKAVIWNTGPGMDPKELKAATQLACRAEKTLGLDDNFGVGAKVSSLANNKRGLRFRSCKDGRVSEATLGFDSDLNEYVRFEYEVNGERATVIDVTASVAKEGRPLDLDWTEVMLCGNSEGQDTVARLYDLETTEKSYVATSLYRRFYRLPEGVVIRLDSDYHRFGGSSRFTPIGQRYDKFARAESVFIPELNVTVHYLHDPNVGDKSGLRMSSRNALGSSTTTCCVVHKNEMYSVITGVEWSASAPHFGIPFGSKELCVHIELHDDDARPSGYRERLITKIAGKDIVTGDFAFCVKERMPDWVKDVIRRASPAQKDNYTDVQKELQDLLNKYKVRAPGRRLAPVGQPSIAGGRHPARSGKGGDGTANLARSFRETPEGAVTTSLHEVYERAPKIIMLDRAEDIAEKGLVGRAAIFVIETGELFVNGLYEAVDRTIADVEPEFVGEADAEAISTAVADAAKMETAFRVGKATVFALAKRVSEDWSEADMAAALSKESLSIAADDYLESLSRVRKRVRDRVKLEKIAA